MAFFRRTFSRRLLPDRFQEITERVYVFDCCLSTKELSEQEYGLYMDTAVSNIQRHHPGASFMVFNFKEGEDPSILSDMLSRHDMTVIDYPRHYEGYPILPLEMINYFLRSSDSWLSLEGQRNVILMHCERRGWPALAFMLAGLLLYTKKQVGEMKTLDLVLKNSPKELWTPLSLMNPRPSQMRYLKYISGRSLTSDWPPPADAALAIQSVVLTDLPLFDGGKGCRPVVHVYCQDPSTKNSARPRLLCSSLMSEDGAHYFKKEECMMVKINLNCRVQGDVFIECIHLGDDLVSEEKIFKVMFHTAFVQSYTMVLNSSEVDVLSNVNCKIPNEFKVEVMFHNPEEVQLRIAKEMASLESGHESESEFFEAEEFDVAVSQHHNSDNLLSKEILFSKLTTEDTKLVLQSEDSQKELDFSSFKSIEPENDRDNLEAQDQRIIEEQIVSQDQSSEQVYEVDNVPIHYLSDEHSSYQTSANVGSESVMEITGSKIEDRDQSVFPVGGKREEYDSMQADVVEQCKKEGSDVAASSLIEYDTGKVFVEVEGTIKHGSSSAAFEAKEQSLEQVSEVDNVPIHYPNDEHSSYQTSEKGNYVSYDDETNVGSESIMEITGGKVHDIDQSVLSVGGNEEEYDSIKVDVVGRSKKEGSEVASSLIEYEANKVVVEVEETTKGGATSATLDATMELISSQEDSFKAPDVSVDAAFGVSEDSLQASPLEASLKPRITVEGSECEPIIMQEAVNQGSEDESEIASSLIAYEASKDGSATTEVVNNAMESVILLDKNNKDSSEVPDLSLDAKFEEIKDHTSEARLEPIIMQEVVNQGSEDVSEIVSSLIAYKASKDIVEAEETAKDGSTSASLEATMELINNAMQSVILLEKKQEDSSKEPDVSVDAEFREIEDYPLEARLEPKIVVEGSKFEPIILQEVVNQGSKDGSGVVIQESSSDETPDSSENAVFLGEITQASSSEAGLELNFADKRFLLVQESQENSSRTGSNSNFEGSEHGCSEISSSEIEYENCIMSKSLTSIEGSEDSSEASHSHTGSESFLVAQVTSSKPTSATKHIVVVLEDSNEHEVKVHVEPRSVSDVGSRGVQQKPKSKKKPMRLADAVAKVTMQKRVISMWVPRDKQLTSDDAKHRASTYKWVPKESGSTSEEASKPGN